MITHNIVDNKLHIDINGDHKQAAKLLYMMYTPRSLLFIDMLDFVQLNYPEVYQYMLDLYTVESPVVPAERIFGDS